MAVEVAQRNAIPWSAARPLVWSDFKGSPPAGGPEGALTGYGLYYAWQCHGHAFDFRITAAFVPRESWVKSIVLTDSTQNRRGLRHEQTHFDLAEVYARKLRKSFAELGDPCARKDGDLKARAQRVLDEEASTQRRYDNETNHGLLAPKQAAWNQEVARLLESLRTYAQ